MKRFSPREFALLCSPLLVVAVAGFLLSRRKPPSPHADKLRLEFHVEKPTTLEAFKGIDAALVVQLKGPNTESSPIKDPLRVWESDAFLEVQTANGVQRSRWSRASGTWEKVWKGMVNNTRLQINSKAIPPGEARFGMNAVLSPMSSAPPPKPLRLSGMWKLDRERIKSFAFAKMGRIPLVRLNGVKIIQINANGNIKGEAIFDLIGNGMNSETPFDYEFKERSGGMGSGSGMSYLTPEAATRRVREWTVYKDLNLSAGQKQMVYVTGRASANERWPLAFSFEPFNYSKAKVGQQLKFQSWPAPLPK